MRWDTSTTLQIMFRFEHEGTLWRMPENVAHVTFSAVHQQSLQNILTFIIKSSGSADEESKSQTDLTYVFISTKRYRKFI